MLIEFDGISSVSEYIKTIETLIREKQNQKYEKYINVSILIEGLKFELSNLTLDETLSREELYRRALKRKKAEQEIERLQIFQKNNKSNYMYNDRTNWQTSQLMKYRFFYRGHYDYKNYRLVPSVMRNGSAGNELEKEDYYYHEIKVQCADKFNGCSHIDQLVLMQHYDCPTRLLDVTSNPLVALFFACKNYGCKKCNTANEGAVYIFAIPENEVLYYDSDRAKMLSCLPRFTYEDKKELYSACVTRIIKGGVFDAKNNGSIVERLYHEIKTETPSFEKKIDPVDLLSSYFVQPLKLNSRILKQDGAFIINGLNLDCEEVEQKIRDMVFQVIKIKDQHKILAELDRLGINEATLFPEVDKVASYLKQR